MSEPLRHDEEIRLAAALSELREGRGVGVPSLQPRSRAVRSRTPSLIDVALAPEQRTVVELPRGRSTLVLGEAGHGKTTVALHRLAKIWRSTKEPLKVAVIVPTDGLTRLLQPLLRKLGVDVEATTYERWAMMQARPAFRDLPRRESEDATAGIMRLKRDPAIRLALEEIARHPPGRIDDDRDVRQSRSRAFARRADLQHLYGDSVLMHRVAKASRDPVSERIVRELLEHTRVQFGKPTEVEFAHVVDRERLVAVDQRPLDRGTATSDVRTVDSEDYAVMFELDRLRAERAGKEATKPRAFDVILIDEAQELAPLELALIGRSLAPGGTLIVAGDEAQQVDPTVTFESWDEAMRELRCDEYETVVLKVGYRCPPPVVAVARHLAAISTAEPYAAIDAPTSLRFADETALVARLAFELDRLSDDDPKASVAVLCRSPIVARRIARWLRARVPSRLVFDGHFRSRGVQVTSIDQVRGLEFDFVVIADADADAYPDDFAARRNLYVAVTRARHQLVCLHVGRASPLLGPPFVSEIEAVTRDLQM